LKIVPKSPRILAFELIIEAAESARTGKLPHAGFTDTKTGRIDAHVVKILDGLRKRAGL
jgi:hypothetical protein